MIDSNSDIAEKSIAANHAELDRQVVTRWGGHELLLSRGFIAVPRTFLVYAPKLGLSPSETLFVLALMTFKWTDEDPFPSYKVLAQRVGTSIPQARKLARQLEERHLLRRIRRDARDGSRSSNAFDLQPLFDRLAVVISESIRSGRARAVQASSLSSATTAGQVDEE